MSCLPWLEQNQTDIHGHTLVWGSFLYCPTGLADKSKAEMDSQFERM